MKKNAQKLVEEQHKKQLNPNAPVFHPRQNGFDSYNNPIVNYEYMPESANHSSEFHGTVDIANKVKENGAVGKENKAVGNDSADMESFSNTNSPNETMRGANMFNYPSFRDNILDSSTQTNLREIERGPFRNSRLFSTGCRNVLVRDENTSTNDDCENDDPSFEVMNDRSMEDPKVYRYQERSTADDDAFFVINFG